MTDTRRSGGGSVSPNSRGVVWMRGVVGEAHAYKFAGQGMVMKRALCGVEAHPNDHPVSRRSAQPCRSCRDAEKGILLPKEKP